LGSVRYGVVKVQVAQEGDVKAWYVTCPVCKNRLALVQGYEPPGTTDIEKLMNEGLDVHLQGHAARGETADNPGKARHR
jgi:phage terminase large subunit GpA-like protein